MPNPNPLMTDERSLFERLRYTPLSDVIRGRITGQLHVSRDIGRSNLPAPLPALVLNVVRRTRLWRTEKADVARELIAHFRDGLESGTSPAELAGMFGDPGRAATLIRRAKKRNRPLLWRAMCNTVRGAAIMIGLIFAVYLVMAARFLIGQPSPSIDYRPQINATAHAVPESQRAWPVYREALRQLGLSPEVAIDTSVWNRRPRPGEEGWQEFEKYLQDHQAALAMARTAASMPGLGYIADYGVTPEDQKLWPGTRLSTEVADDVGMYGLLLPYLASMRNLGKTLQLDIERAAAAGDGVTATADITAMLGIAGHTREMPLYINDLVSLAVFNLAMATLNDVLSTWPQSLTDAQLRELAHRLAAFDDSMLKVRLDGERIGFNDLLQRIYTDDGHGDGRMTLAGWRRLDQLTLSGSALRAGGYADATILTGPPTSAIILGRQDMLNEFDRLLDLAIAESAMPLWKRDRLRFDQELDAIMGSRFERLRKYPIGSFMPALGRAGIEAELTRTSRDGTLVVIAAELYRRQRGHWPASLHELVPGLLPSVPVDRYDGGPLKYALIDGHPVVYSVGANRVDDGGHAPVVNGRSASYESRRWSPPSQSKLYADGDWVLWPTWNEPRYKYNVYPD